MKEENGEREFDEEKAEQSSKPDSDVDIDVDSESKEDFVSVALKEIARLRQLRRLKSTRKGRRAKCSLDSSRRR